MASNIGRKFRCKSNRDSDECNGRSATKLGILFPTESSNQVIKVTSKKRRRGIIEKQRRDRINSCLLELKKLVPAAIEKQGCQKLEKAEILQLTVDHLKVARSKIQESGTDTSKIARSIRCLNRTYVYNELFNAGEVAICDSQQIAREYLSIGFKECLNEITRYLSMAGQEPCCEVKELANVDLLRHLTYFYTSTYRSPPLTGPPGHSATSPASHTPCWGHCSQPVSHTYAAMAPEALPWLTSRSTLATDVDQCCLPAANYQDDTFTSQLNVVGQKTPNGLPFTFGSPVNLDSSSSMSPSSTADDNRLHVLAARGDQSMRMMTVVTVDGTTGHLATVLKTTDKQRRFLPYAVLVDKDSKTDHLTLTDQQRAVDFGHQHTPATQSQLVPAIRPAPPAIPPAIRPAPPAIPPAPPAPSTFSSSSSSVSEGFFASLDCLALQPMNVTSAPRHTFFIQAPTVISTTTSPNTAPSAGQPATFQTPFIDKRWP